MQNLECGSSSQGYEVLNVKHLVHRPRYRENVNSSPIQTLLIEQES